MRVTAIYLVGEYRRFTIEAAAPWLKLPDASHETAVYPSSMTVPGGLSEYPAAVAVLKTGHRANADRAGAVERNVDEETAARIERLAALIGAPPAMSPPGQPSLDSTAPAQ